MHAYTPFSEFMKQKLLPTIRLPFHHFKNEMVQPGNNENETAYQIVYQS